MKVLTALTLLGFCATTVISQSAPDPVKIFDGFSLSSKGSDDVKYEVVGIGSSRPLIRTPDGVVESSQHYIEVKPKKQVNDWFIDIISSEEKRTEKAIVLDMTLQSSVPLENAYAILVFKLPENQQLRCRWDALPPLTGEPQQLKLRFNNNRVPESGWAVYFYHGDQQAYIKGQEGLADASPTESFILNLSRHAAEIGSGNGNPAPYYMPVPRPPIDLFPEGDGALEAKLRLKIGKKGQVEDHSFVNELPEELEAFLSREISDWLFFPRILNGERVDVEVVLPLIIERPGASTRIESRKNILMIGIDDLRPELACYGASHMVTPNLDRLSGESIRFDRAYTQQAVCLPSRISLYSGQYPQTTGVTTLQDKFWEMHDNPLTLMRYLRENGYHAVAMGKILHDEQWREWDDWTELMNKSNVLKSRYASPESEKALALLEKEARRLGLRGKEYRQYVRLGPVEKNFGEDDRYHDYAMTDIAIEKLAELKDSDEPFFMNVGYRKPHLPFVAPKRYWDLYDRDDLKLASNPYAPEGAPEIALTTWGELRAFKGVPDTGPVSGDMALDLIHGYYACVSFVDDQIGRLLKALDEEGLRENTLVIVWSDHGWKLGEHGMWCKHTNYEIDTRIPLFIRLPDGRQAGETAGELTELIDLYPTICDYIGLPVPEHCEGKSLTYLFDDPSQNKAEAAYSEFQRHGGVTGFSLKSGHFRYTEWIHLKSGEIRGRELYDHDLDPDENMNQAENPAYSQQIESLSPILHKGPAGRYAGIQ